MKSKKIPHTFYGKSKKMRTIKSKLLKINYYWNKYYFTKEFFQKKINFTDEVKTNYYGDLNNYLHDTLDLVKSFKKTKSDKDYISQTIVLLQVIYTHQDLIDELLYIFKLEQSTKEDKSPNRDIRNELIGHPISRDKRDNNKLNPLNKSIYRTLFEKLVVFNI